MTLIELLLVVVLLAVISTLAVTRLDSVAIWQHESELRRFSNLVSTLQQQANNRGEAYRIILDLDSESYAVRREVPLDRNEIKEVDYLENLRTKSEKERREKKKQEAELEQESLEEEFRKEDLKQTGALVPLFYQNLYRDPHADVRLSVPLDTPSLAEQRNLPGGLTIRDFEDQKEQKTNGTTYLRLAPRERYVPGVIHFESADGIYSLYVNPATGRVKVEVGDISFSEAFAREDKNSESKFRAN